MRKESNATIGEMQRKGMKRLRDAGIENPGLDVRFLLGDVLQLQPAQLISADRQEMAPEKCEAFEAMIDLRLAGKPVHRILGHREFYGRRIDFGDGCLEPRPETELLVERVLQDVDKAHRVSFLEIGTGSGAIIVTLLAELANACGVGTDIEPLALAQTLKNARRHLVEERIELVEADCFPATHGKFNFIVSNPPYIASGDIAALSREVRESDPRPALDGGMDGMDIYRRIFDRAPGFLLPEGRLYLETGHGQHDMIISIATKKGWGIVSRHLDLSKLERIVVFEKI